MLAPAAAGPVLELVVVVHALGRFLLFHSWESFCSRASCKIPSSGIGFGCAVDFAGFGRQEIAAPSIGGRGKDNARCFQARRDFAD